MTLHKFFPGLAVYMVVAFLVLALLWGTWLLVERTRLGAVEAKIRADGLATTPGEILPAPVAPENNAAPLLKQADAQLKALKETGFAFGVPGSGKEDADPLLFDAEKLGELKSKMASPEVQSILNLLRKASAKPACQFDRDYGEGAFMELNGLTALLNGPRLLGMSAWLRAKEGDAIGAFEDLLTIARLAGMGLEDPLLLGWLVGVTADRAGIQTAQAVLGEISPEELPIVQLRDLGRHWAAHAAGARGGLLRALDAERIFFVGWMFQTIYPRKQSLVDIVEAWTFADSPHQPSMERRMLFWVYEYPFHPLMVADHRAYLDSMLALRERIREGSAAHLSVEDADIKDRIPPFAILTRLGFPVFVKQRSRLDEYEVELQLAQVGLALEEWRASHADYPATLGELGLPPEMLRNPFSDQPLVYRRTPEGVTVCSVRNNCADDGEILRKNKQPGDVVWSVQRSTP